MRATIFSVNPNINCVCSSVTEILNRIQYMFTMNENDLFELKVILNELLINAISHGNNFDCNKKVLVVLKKVYNKYIYIGISDEGTGFDYKNSINHIVCNESINDTCCEHGRGLLIVRNLCDKMKFNHTGNKVSILKILL